MAPRKPLGAKAAVERVFDELCPHETGGPCLPCMERRVKAELAKERRAGYEQALKDVEHVVHQKADEHRRLIDVFKSTGNHFARRVHERYVGILDGAPDSVLRRIMGIAR